MRSPRLGGPFLPLLFLAVLIGGMIVVPTRVGAAATGISGTVTDATTHAAIAGATVTTQPATTTTTTDSSGGFSLAVAPGTYSVIATANQYNANYASATVSSGATTSVAIGLKAVPPLGAQDLFTRPAQTGIGTASDGHVWTDDFGSNPNDTVAISSNHLSITAPSGSAYDAFTGISYQDQTVTVEANIGASGLSVLGRVQAQGTWVMLNVAPGSNDIFLYTAVNNSYHQLGVYAGAPVIQPNTRYLLKLGAFGTTLGGKIWTSGAPEPDWQVTATQTAVSGPGVGGIRIAGSSGTFYSWTELPLTQVSGRVTDATTGQQIQGATVSAAGGASTTADDNGNYVLPLTAGSSTVTASATSHQPVTQTVSVSTGVSTTASFALPSGPPPPPPSGNSTITGTVSDATTGAPLANALVTTVPATGSVATSSTGSFTLSIAAGTYGVVATQSGYNANFQTVTTTAGGTATAAIGLNAVPPQVAQDQFTRPNQSGIGMATDGHPWGDDHNVYPLGVESISGRQLVVQTYSGGTDFDAWMGSSIRDQEVTADVMLTRGNGLRVLARVVDLNDYLLALFNTSGQVQLWVASTSGWSQVGSGTASVALNTWYHTKFDVSGTSMSAKIWAFGAAEPGWQATATQSTLSAPGRGGFRAAISDVTVAAVAQRPLNVATGSVAGTVTSAAGGQPVAGATVTLTGGATATSSASGTYSISGLLPGTYTAAVSASGYQPAFSQVTVSAGQTASGSVALNPTSGTVSGVITDALSGQPLAGATVALAGAGSATTASNGAYSIGGLAPGTYTLTASATAHQSATQSATAVSGQTTTVNVALTPLPGSVSGNVTASGGGAVAGATVSLGAAGSTTTDSGGAYSIGGVTPGSYTLTVTAAGYQTATQPVSVGAGQSVTANAVLSPSPGSVTGTVADGTTSQPISGATVALSGGAGSTTSSASGAYSLGGVAPGTYTLTVSAAGYQTATAGVTVVSGQTTTANVALTPSPGGVSGTVTDATTSQAVAGATLTLSGGAGTATSGSGGGFAIASVPSGTYTLTASAPAYQTATQSVTVPAGQIVTAVVQLTPSPGSVSGTVVAASTGNPIAGASASLSGGAGAATTDASGNFAITSVAPGAYTLTVSASGYQSSSQAVSVAAGQSTSVSVSLQAGPGSVSGVVTDAGTGQPITGASVAVSGGGSTTTDSQGGYSIAGVAPGTQTLTVSASGYQSASLSVTVTTGQTTSANAALTSTSGGVSGSVTDATTGQPIAGASVSLGSAGTTTTNSSGVYAFGGVTPGTYTLTTTASGYQTATQSVTISAGTTASANVSLSPAPGAVSGHVLDATTGQGISGGTATLSGGAGSATSGTSGSYLIGGVAAGTYTLTASASGYQTASQSVIVAAGQTTTADITLTPVPGSVSGTVTAAATGQPVAGASVVLSGAGGSATSGAQGTYAIASVPPGTYGVTVSAAGYATFTTNVTVASGQTAIVNAALTAALGTVSGTVTDSSSGAPVAGATVTTQPATSTATTDSSGSYSLGVASGSYSVIAAAAGYNTNFATATVSSGSAISASVGLVAVPSGTAMDLFSRPDQTGVGTASDGHAWTDDSAQNSAAHISISGRQLVAQVASGAYDAWMGTPYQDEEVAADFTATSGGGARIMARVQGSGSFVLLSANAGSGLVIWVAKANAWTSLASVSTTVALNTAYHAKLDVIGNLVQAKVWPVGASEPGWQVSVSQSTLTGSGVAGLRVAGATAVFTRITETPITQISGTVTTSSGTAIANAPVSLSNGAQTTTSSTGAYAFGNLAPGTYTVTAAPSGSTPQSASATVRLGVSASANFRF